MSFRKLIPILLFLSGAILGKPLALGTVGLFAKAYLYFENGWRFSYGSIDWHEGKLIFKEIGLKEAMASLHAKSVSIGVRERHLEIEQPVIRANGIPNLKTEGGSDWTIEIKEGSFAGNELENLQFSFERTWRHHLGRLVLHRKGSQMTLEAIEEENEIWIHANLHQFETDSLKHWIDLKGVADGRIHLVFEGKKCKRGSAHLDFHDAGYGSNFYGAEGTFDWEGEAGEERLFDWLNEGRVRLKIAKASFNGFKGSIDKLKGDLSFTSGVGAKWEFSAEATSKDEEFPIHWSGRAFLHSARSHWAESTLFCRNARIFLKGEQEEEGFRWKGEGKAIGAVEGTLIQSLWAFADKRAEQVEFEEGLVHVEGQALFSQEGIQSENSIPRSNSMILSGRSFAGFDFSEAQWNMALKVDHLTCQSKLGALACRKGEMQWTSEENGRFKVSGASLQALMEEGKALTFDEWEGDGIIEQGVLVESHFEGNIEKIKGVFKAFGTFGQFHLEGRGENCEIALKGSLNEKLDFEIEEGRFDGLAFQGTGSVDPSFFSLHLNRFYGSMTPLFRALGVFENQEGRIESVGSGFSAEGNFGAFDWFLQAKGKLGALSFYCPILEKKEESYSFDIRIEAPTWDLARFYGTAEVGNCRFDSTRTHFLGMPVQVDSCLFDSDGLVACGLKVPISWKSLLAAAPLWFPQTAQWISAPMEGTAMMDLSYTRSGGSAILLSGESLQWKGNPFFFHCLAHQQAGGWHLSTLQIDQCSLSFDVFKEGQTLRLSEGHALWRTEPTGSEPMQSEPMRSEPMRSEPMESGLDAAFSGMLDSSFQFELDLSHVRLNLSQIEPIARAANIPLHGLEGILEGKGTFSRRDQLVADFDFSAIDLKAASLDWKNEGAIHLRYESATGLLCSGLDLTAKGPNLPFFACKIGLLQFDAPRSLWMMNRSLFYLPPRFLDLFPERPLFLKQFNLEKEIQFSAEIECPSDFSALSCSLSEVSLPLGDTLFPIRNLTFSLDKKEAIARFELEHQGYPIKVLSHAAFEDKRGRLILEDGESSLSPEERPLGIDWSYSNESGFLIREIDGRFGGVEASFHALDAGTTLIGSARIDFETVSKIIPQRIAQVFTDLKMGKGYELKGKLFLGDGISFRGLFTGKQIDLFGFQLRTLLSQFEFDPDRIRLSDLKVSDSAGMLKIDELVAAANGDAPWIISIPHLSILELRPSLLQKPGSTPQPAGPLVVREMKIDDFQGLLEDSKTYTAKGALSFINSFRREHTVFDIPSDLLGRIVGLDLELLIPACGILQYELKNGFFHLTRLIDSFSEGQRSEFFLVPEPLPMMDLDGNLHILVSMKQFVLFKLTESFQILIDGKLDDPQFHLQKKRRFLGL